MIEDNGFTLIEVVVTLMVLCITIPSMFGMFTWCSGAYHRLDSSITALTVAMSIIDRIKAGDIDETNLQQQINDYMDAHDVLIEIETIHLQHRPDALRVSVRHEGLTGWVTLSTYADGVDIDWPVAGNHRCRYAALKY
jgi:prepilin-type N-terminal cleavage/methylation domain-containing protein